MDEGITDEDIVSFTKGLEEAIVNLSKKHSEKSYFIDISRNIVPIHKTIKFYENEKK